MKRRVAELTRTPIDITAEREKLVEARRARPPMGYHPSLVTFHCLCQAEHMASDEMISCRCGRRWVRNEMGGAA